ncbi:guanine deaminase isoform X4 [Heterodontus francisci]|uniref:guanine deaminase isoform X4 n=1 Tax=Heterodontus francisci TaxID=7792 RepID=UPI00355AFAB8
MAAKARCSQNDRLQVFKGTFIHSTDSFPLEILDPSLLGVNEKGKIVFIEAAGKEEELSQTWHFKKENIRVLRPKEEFFIPGLIDTHIHASQYPNMGSCLDLPLLQWLVKYTFPVEAKFKDLKFAEDTYTKVVYPLVKPIVTPRFVPSCSSELLQQLGSFANSNNLHIQSHISESHAELDVVKEIFPKCKDYSDVYDKHGLLTDKTIMAHGVYLSDEELKLFHKKGAAISHCPNSNISLCSGLFDIRNALNHKVNVGLGTDVSGGYSPSVLNAVRAAMDVTKILSLKASDNESLSYEEIFRVATLGGSQALGLDKLTGNFEVGKDFDAVLVNTNVPNNPFEVFPNDTLQDIFQKFLFLGDDRNMVEVYVAGKQVIPFPKS